jgi:hypothetical protein
MAFSISEIQDHLAEETSPSFRGTSPVFMGDVVQELLDTFSITVSDSLNNVNSSTSKGDKS